MLKDVSYLALRYWEGIEIGEYMLDLLVGEAKNDIGVGDERADFLTNAYHGGRDRERGAPLLAYATVSLLHDVFCYFFEFRMLGGKYDILLIEGNGLFLGKRRVAGGALIKGMCLLSGNLVIFGNPAVV